MYKLIHKAYYDCFEDCLCTVLHNHNRNIDTIFCNAWDVCVWNRKTKKIFTTEPDLTNFRYLLKKYYGIQLNKIVINTNDEFNKLIKEYDDKKSELIMGIDMYYLPWSEYYNKIHSIHYIILLNWLEGDKYLCADPTQNIIHELEIKKLDYVMHFVLLEGIENQTEIMIDETASFKEQYNRFLKAEERDSYPLLFVFAEKFLTNYSEIFDSNEVLEDVGFIRYLLYMSRKRLAYAFFLENHSFGEDNRLIEKLKNLSTMWANFRLSIMKSLIKKDWELTAKKHCEKLKEILTIEFELYKEYMEWWEMKENACCTIEKEEQNTKETIENRALKEIQIELSDYYNSTAFWKKENCRDSVGFDHCGYYYKGIDKTAEYEKQFDNVRCSGQRIMLKQEFPIVGIRLCGSAECGNYGGAMKFSEKNQESLFFNFTDWREVEPLFNEEIKTVYECCDKEGRTGYGNCNIYKKDFLWNKPIMTKYLQLPDCNNLHIFSIQLFTL